MDNPSYLHKINGRESLSVILVAFVLLHVLLMGVFIGQADAAEQDRTMLPVVQYLLDVGKKQYEQGFYEQSEKTFLTAQGYEQYLTKNERNRLQSLLNKSHEAAVARASALKDLKTAEELLAQNKGSVARSYLNRIQDNPYLTERERKHIAGLLGQDYLPSSDSRSSVFDKLFGKKKSGETESPDVIASDVQTDAWDEIGRMDRGISRGVDESQSLAEGLDTASDTQGTGGSYLEAVKRKRNIVRSHVSTVISDTKIMVEACIENGQYGKAEQAIDTARTLVENNQAHLGPERTRIYIAALRDLREKVAQGKKEYDWVEDQSKRQEAVKTQAVLEQQQEVEKQKTVIELMERARSYARQNRYAAALGQLESLLAKDPHNQEALIYKEEIEDMIRLRKQRDLRRESDEELGDLMLETEESMIPMTGEMSYPKNWREVVAKPTRQPDLPIMFSESNTDVYKQLDRIVDLSSLSPEMSAGEAFELLRTSVDPPLNIVVFWKDLFDNAEIEPATNIDMDGLGNVRLVTALESLIQALAGGFYELGFMVEGGVVKVATVQSLPRKLETRIYDISDLISEPLSPFISYMRRMMGIQMARMQHQMASQYIQTTVQEGVSTGGGTGTGGGGTGGGVSSSGGGMMGGGSMMGGGMGGGMGGMGGETGGGTGSRGMGDMAAQELIVLIQEGVEPETWFNTSTTGEGTITPFPSQQPQKLAILQTREVHLQLERMFDDLRQSIGRQVTIEARFLAVGSNFLEDIGLDVDFNMNAGSNWGWITFDQDGAEGVKTIPTDVAGSIGGITPAAKVGGAYEGAFLNDMQVRFLLRATQGRSDTKTLSAPRATVLSGDSALFNLANVSYFALPPDIYMGVQQGVTIGTAGVTSQVEHKIFPVVSGNILMITPTIMKDKKNVLLSINLLRNKLLGIKTQSISAPIPGFTQVQNYDVTTPEVETTELSTRVMVPDNGTLLLGGQRVTSMVEKEVGVPILSKIPILGRAFSNSSQVQDEMVLLLLVRPTILIPEERESEAIREMEAAEAHAF